MASEDGDGEFLSTEEAARLVGFSPGTIRRWAREGRIPSSVEGGRRRFRRDDVEAVARRINNHR